MKNAKELNEALIPFVEDKDAQNKHDFCEQVETIVENEFKPVAQKLTNLVKTFKELYPDTNESSLPYDISREIDYIALTAANLFDMLNDTKSNTKKIRKALGYDS